MQVFRLHIRPKGGLADHLFSFDYCRKNGVLGLGWPVESPPESDLTWEQYEDLATKKYGKKDLSRVKNLREKVKPDDLIWTRDKGGKYFLAKVQSTWEYLDTEDGRKADIVNVVRCKIEPVPRADDVPGKIVAHFRAPMSIQRVTEPTATSYSRRLWNHLTVSQDYLVEPEDSNNLFALLGSETTEDVIFIYLQMNGWLILPSSRKADTMRYEFTAINLDDHTRAVVQVKTGETPLNTEDYVNVDEQVFLFQANGNYRGKNIAGVERLRPPDIEKFIRERIQIMPGVVQKWIKYLDEGDIR
jgi:hypothetical protein